MKKCSVVALNKESVIWGQACVGGLIGNSYNKSAEEKTHINQSSAAINVKVRNPGKYASDFGGLIGAASYTKTENSYSRGDVDGGSGGSSIGGFIGYINNVTNTIINSYSSGGVKGKKRGYVNNFIGRGGGICHEELSTRLLRQGKDVSHIMTLKYTIELLRK